MDRYAHEGMRLATQSLAAMGLSVSDAVPQFLRRVVADQAFPFELKVPNAEMRAAMEESRITMSTRQASFPIADKLFADLEKTAASECASLPRAADYAKVTDFRQAVVKKAVVPRSKPKPHRFAAGAPTPLPRWPLDAFSLTAWMAATRGGELILITVVFGGT